MQKAAAHPPEADHHDPAPVPRDPDLPALSDTALMLFAGAALIVTAVALLVLAR
jgi:hypothetical protein